MKKTVSIISVVVLLLCTGCAYAWDGVFYVNTVNDFTMFLDTYFGMQMTEVQALGALKGGYNLLSSNATNGDPVRYVRDVTVAGVAGTTVYYYFSALTKQLYQVIYEFPYSAYGPVWDALVKKYGSALSFGYKNPNTPGTDFYITIRADVLFNAVSKFNVQYSIEGDYRDEITMAKVNMNGL